MKILHWLSLGAFIAGSTSLLVAGCHTSAAGSHADGSTTDSGHGGTTGAGTGGTTGGGGTTGHGGTNGYDGPTLGQDAAGKLGTTQCSDGIDNDKDGLTDYLDPECTGPLDNDESSFATGIPGDNVDACKQDCFFDGNSGMGDDGCEWQLKCDPLSKEAKCPYDSNYASTHAKECSVSMSQTDACVHHCQALVPNGCDCFGCCVIPGAPTPIRLATTCTAADFGNPAKCPACTQVSQCANPCEHCEICVGKPTLPADCGGAGGTGGTPGTDGAPPPPPVPVCSNGYMPCGPGGIDPATCPAGTGCLTGCCIPTSIVP